MGVTVALIGSRVLVCYAASTGTQLQIFRRRASLDLSVKQSEQSENGEDGGTMIRRNDGNYLPVDTA